MAANANLLDVFVPTHSKGLMVDAAVLQMALGRDRVRILKVPYEAGDAPLEVNDRNLSFEPASDTAVFVERLFEHSRLGAYARRILLPNPEWLTEADCRRADRAVTEFWHKTRYSLDLLSTTHPRNKHVYIGFTSPCEPARVNSHASFVHLSGRSGTRHTQELVDIWLNNPGLPSLTWQNYGSGISIPRWIKLANMEFYLGFLDDAEHRRLAARHGIHLCASQMEGFGHHINEARALGALVVTLDGAPMNELVDPSSGLLIQPGTSQPHHCAMRFIATREAIEEAIARVIAMPVDARRALGDRARDRFVSERDQFFARIRSVVL